MTDFRGNEASLLDPRPFPPRFSNMKWSDIITEAAQWMIESVSTPVDVQGNWRRFDELAPDAHVLLYHATSETGAHAIIQGGGFHQDRKVWRGSVDGYVFLGGSPRSIEMYGLHAAQRAGGGKHAILSVVVRKGDLLPDDGKDWVTHCKNKGNRAFVAEWFGKDAIRKPTVTTTFACIGQVRAPFSAVTPKAIVEMESW